MPATALNIERLSTGRLAVLEYGRRPRNVLSIARRYSLPAMLLVVGAIVGGSAGFLASPRMYVAKGLFAVGTTHGEPFWPRPDEREISIALRQHLASLRSPEFLRSIGALQGDEVPPCISGEDGMAVLRNRLHVDVIKGSVLIRVEFEDKDAKVAARVATSVMEHYRDEEFDRSWNAQSWESLSRPHVGSAFGVPDWIRPEMVSRPAIPSQPRTPITGISLGALTGTLSAGAGLHRWRRRARAA
jgi:hypothetical protein